MLRWLLCALLLGLTSVPASALCRPETRVGGSPVFSPNFASKEMANPVGTPSGNGGCGYDFASGVHKYLYAQDNPVMGSDPSGRAAYFVERNLNITAGSLGWELGFGHGYLLFTSTSDPGTGDPFDTHQPILDTFSWHPNVWDYDRDAWPGVPGRLWEMHPTDTTPGSQHKALLLTTDSSQQSSLMSYINGWISMANPGREYGSPQTDPHDLHNDIGDPHRAAPPGGVYYSLGGQNCVWWATTMIMQSNIKVPQSVYTEITKYNHGIGNADVEIGLGLSDSAFDVGTLSGIPLGVKVAGLPGYDFSGFDTGL
jgi:hypothetical protein